ncbi:hypothetical protein JHK86_040554 [Glycine max]|nr:hypothetical protein JHK86_040554 [Glycine max]
MPHSINVTPAEQHAIKRSERDTLTFWLKSFFRLLMVSSGDDLRYKQAIE